MEFINSSFTALYQDGDIIMDTDLVSCLGWIPSESNQLTMLCESGSSNQNLIKLYNNPYRTIFEPTLQILAYPVTLQNVVTLENQLKKIFEEFSKVSTILNQDEIIEFMEELSLPAHTIEKTFFDINKIVSSNIPGAYKLFTEKYDDPETKDHFIAINIRQKTYPDDFIDKVWEVRDIFLASHPKNNWVLITTDYIPLTD